MKILPSQPAVWAAFVGLLLSPSVFAQKPLNLSIFAGKYTGVVTLATPGDTSSGSATVIIRVPKNGRTATISYRAAISSGGSTTVLPTQIALAKNKTIVVTDLGVGIAGTNNAHPGRGIWSQRRHALVFSATNGDIDLRGAVRARDVGRKRKLTLTLVSSDAGGSNVFTNTLTAKLPRPNP
jgi:hypothetical protein